MTREEVATLKGALDGYIAELAAQADRAELELEVARVLRTRAAAALDTSVHLRDEDVVPEVIRPGDLMRVQAALLKSWLDSPGGMAATVVVTNIIAEPDGTKTVVVGAAVP